MGQVQADKATARRAPQAGAAIVSRVGGNLHAPGGRTADTASLNDNPRVQSLMQMRHALDQSPCMQSQQALQRARNPAAAATAQPRFALSGRAIQRQCLEAAQQPGVVQALWPFDWIAEQYHDYRRLSALNDVMQEAVTTMNLPNVNINQHAARSEMVAPLMPGVGMYQVNINPNDPVPEGGPPPVMVDPDKMMTAFLHELTHVSVDRGYAGANLGRPGGEEPENLQVRGNVLERNALILQVDHLEQTFQHDNLIPATEQAFIQGRINYMGANITTEFDTVANELLYYLYLKGVPARSAFSRELTGLVRERKQLRG